MGILILWTISSSFRCISALASNHSAASLTEASQGLLPPEAFAAAFPGSSSGGPGGGGGCLLPLLEQLTLALAAGGGVGACDDEPWLHDCTEMMLEVWMVLH